MLSLKMANFVPSGPIFKIQNSKYFYSKSYKQLDKYESVLSVHCRELFRYINKIS